MGEYNMKQWTRAILFICCFGSISVIATDFRRGRVNPKIRIIKGPGPLVKELKVVNGNKILFHYSTKNIAQSLDRSGLVKPQGKDLHLVSFWSTGAHSQIMYVHNLGKKGTPESQELKQCRRISAWPIFLDGNENNLIIKQSGYSIDPETNEPNIEISQCPLSN